MELFFKSLNKVLSFLQKIHEPCLSAYRSFWSMKGVLGLKMVSMHHPLRNSLPCLAFYPAVSQQCVEAPSEIGLSAGVWERKEQERKAASLV